MANAQHVAGTWNIDPTHTTLSFTASVTRWSRRFAFQFNEFEGSNHDRRREPEQSSVGDSSRKLNRHPLSSITTCATGTCASGDFSRSRPT